MNKIASILTVVCLGMLLAFNWGLLPLFPPLQQAIIPPPPVVPPPPVLADPPALPPIAAVPPPREDSPPPLAVKPPPPLEHFVNDLVNEHRAGRGLKPLALSPEISAIARVHSEDMASGRVPVSHAGADARAEKISNLIPYQGFGENVAKMNRGREGGEAKAARGGWLQSPGHRRNIEGDFTLTGIGIARSGDGAYYFTQLFVSPAPSPVPSIAGVPAPAETDPPPSASPAEAHNLFLTELELEVYELINENRVSLGLTPLSGRPATLLASLAPEPHCGVPALPGPLIPATVVISATSPTSAATKRTRKVRSNSTRPARLEKDPRQRPGRRRTAGGWAQNLGG